MNEPTQLPAHIRAVVVKPIGQQPPLRVHGTFFDAETGTLTIGVTMPDRPSPTSDGISPEEMFYMATRGGRLPPRAPTADEIFAELERKAHARTNRIKADMFARIDAAYADLLAH